MCHVTGVSVLKCVPLSSTSLGGFLKGEDTSREICLICTDGLCFVSAYVRSRVYIFSHCLHNTVLFMNVCVCVSQTAVS